MNLPSLETIELKFLLKLLSQPDYRTAMSKLTPGKSASERDKACKSLCSKGLVEYATKIEGYSIEPSGKALLNLDAVALPISAEELKVLEAGKSGKRVTPGKISKTVPSDRRQGLIRSLEERGFAKVSDRDVKLTEAWLTPQGDRFLREQFEPSGGATISLNLLKNYLKFMRKEAILGEDPDHVEPSHVESNRMKPSGEELLDLIGQLDQRYNTDNYLPIYYLREQLPLERQVLDRLIYQLQRERKIKLDTLQETSGYTDTQIASGIPQDIGGPIFFISLVA